MTGQQTATAYDATAVLAAVDHAISYRQLDYWARNGWVGPAGAGSGHPRRWSNVDVRVVRAMAALVGAGLRPDVAARHAARARAPFVREIAVRLAPGVLATVDLQPVRVDR